jgi:TetR/AcrR family transcriptional regulator, mexJK operon transcriptional repressor
MESQAAAETGGPEDAGRTARKRQGIAEAATAAFLRNGYLGTSMDEIAALAGVSKQTVYKQFADKERLFTEIVLGIIDQVGEPFFGGIDALEDTEDLETDLRKLAGQLITIVTDPQLLQLRRLVIGEAGRFPELGRSYFERGPGRSTQTLASRFQLLAERGLLRLDDAHLAAQHFNWLVLSIPLNQAMFSVDLDFSPAELDRYADEAVRIFLAAYGQS